MKVRQPTPDAEQDPSYSQMQYIQTGFIRWLESEGVRVEWRLPFAKGVHGIDLQPFVPAWVAALHETRLPSGIRVAGIRLGVADPKWLLALDAATRLGGREGVFQLVVGSSDPDELARLIEAPPGHVRPAERMKTEAVSAVEAAAAMGGPKAVLELLFPKA